MSSLNHAHAPDIILCPECTGTWLVKTSSGTTYRFDLDAKTVTRVPNEAQAVEDWESEEMRRDGEPLPFYAFIPIGLGQRTIIAVGVLVDEVPGYVATNRHTTPVVSVKQV